jgi:hypothetical protein
MDFRSNCSSRQSNTDKSNYPKPYISLNLPPELQKEHLVNHLFLFEQTKLECQVCYLILYISQNKLQVKPRLKIPEFISKFWKYFTSAYL